MKTGAAFVSELVAAGRDRTPLQTDHGVTFVHLGNADSVEVVVMEDRYPKIGAMRQVDKRDVWFVETLLDSDGSIEYKLAITRHGKRRLVLDPANPVQSKAPFGSNSVASGISYQPPSWLTEPSPPGAIRSFPVPSRVWDRVANHQLFLPAGFSKHERLPLLILHDGPEYIRYADLKLCLDVMIAGGQIPPLLVLLHEPHARNDEYVDNPLHLEHLFDEVLPRLRSEYQIGAIYAGGASLGAVASLTAAYRNPGAIDGLLLQSGSFVSALGGPFKRGAVLEPVTQILPQILRNPDRLPSRLVLSCGTYDGLVEDHRTLVPRLVEMLPGTRYSEIHAGHHWRCWRDRLEPDLLSLFKSA